MIAVDVPVLCNIWFDAISFTFTRNVNGQVTCVEMLTVRCVLGIACFVCTTGSAYMPLPCDCR